jgi:hypothetical protein
MREIVVVEHTNVEADVAWEEICKGGSQEQLLSKKFTIIAEKWPRRIAK